LKLGSLSVVHAGNESYPLAKKVRAIAARDLVEKIG